MAQSEARDYPLDNEEETGRLAGNLGIYKVALDGKLIQAPVDFSSRPMRILDSGTADGFWLRELRSLLPSSPKHIFVGTDINPRFLSADPPEGMSFHLQNVNEPWPSDWQNSFDVVHQRLVLAGTGPQSKEAVTRLCELVKPGGWIQLVEAEPVVDDSGPAMHQLLALIHEMFRAFRTGTEFPRLMAGWIRDAGFEDVGERVIPMYLGASSPDPELARQGIASTVTAAKGLAEYLKLLPTPEQATRMTDELDTLVPRLKAELTERGACYPHRIAWGRKPA